MIIKPTYTSVTLTTLHQFKTVFHNLKRGHDRHKFFRINEIYIFPEIIRNESGCVFDVATFSETSGICLSHVEAIQVIRDLADQCAICRGSRADVI